MFEPKKILVPTDFSEASDKALGEAIDVARKYHSKIYILHVIDKAVQQCAVDYCLPIEIMEQLEKESVDRSQEKMKEEVAKLTGSQSVEIDFDIKKGVPYDEILKEQNERGIDLIVIASHGRTGLSKFMLGDVADKVVKTATVPILLVSTSL